MQNEQRVLDGAGHRAKLVEGPAQSHGAGARNAAVSGTQPGDAATHTGADDASAGLAADREAHQSCGRGGAWASARTGGAFFEQPWIHGLPTKPNVIEREGAEAEFC